MSPQILDASGRVARRDRPSSDTASRISKRGQEILEGFRGELAAIKKTQDERLNSSGLQGLVDTCFPQTGPGFQSTTALPSTLSNNNSYVPISLNRILLSYSYMTQGLLRTVVDQVVEDAFRGGIRFKSDELEEEDLALLNRNFKRQRGRKSSRGTPGAKVNVNAGYNLANSDLQSVKQACKWARLYGGAGLIVNTDQDFRTELDVDRIREDSPLTFIAADRWELILSQMNIFDDRIPTPFNYYGLDLHRSRVMKLIWAEAPSYIRLRLQGWGMSILEESIRPVNAFLKFEDLLFELLDEAKIDVYKITGFDAALASESATSKIARRIALSNQMKNYQNALVMDAKDEYEQKVMGSFTGIADIWEGLRINLCAYLKFPTNKLFGQSAGGFGSGKDSLDNYNSTVECMREVAEPLAVGAGELRSQQLFGFIPEDLEAEFSPLDVLDGVEQEQVKTSKQARAIALFTTGLTDGKETSEILKKEELLVIDTAVLKGLREPEPPLSQNPDEVEGAQKHEQKLAAAKPAPAAGAKK